MFLLGHIGIALVLFAPIGVVLLRRKQARVALIGIPVVVTVTLLPDIDLWLPMLVHRGLTHTVWFALACGVSLALLLNVWCILRRRNGVVELTLVGFLFGTVAIVAHLFGDVITPMGIRPFSPLVDARYSFNLVYASDPTANAHLFTLGCLATVTQLLFGAGLPQLPTRLRRHIAPGELIRGIEISLREPFDVLADSADFRTSLNRWAGDSANLDADEGLD